MKVFMCVAIILFGLAPVFAGEKPARIYTNQDLERYRTNSGNANASSRSFGHAGFSRCYDLDTMSESQLKSFLTELDSMQEHYMSKSVSDEAKEGILKSIKTCREKVEGKLRAKKGRTSQEVLSHI